MYKGKKVGSRKADIVLTTPFDNKKVAIECKALRDLNSSHLKQLQFYMHHLGIDTGFLINFPHDEGFPNVPTTVTSAIGNGTKTTTTTTFIHTFLQSNRATSSSSSETTLSDRTVRSRNAKATVQIVKVHCVPSSSQLAQSFVQQQETNAAATITFVDPQIQRGTPCKNCTKKQELCHQHR